MSPICTTPCRRSHTVTLVIIGAAFDDPECRMELICDGYHIHGAVVRATFSMMGSERMVLISDSMMATGMPERNVFSRGTGCLDERRKSNTD